MSKKLDKTSLAVVLDELHETQVKLKVMTERYYWAAGARAANEIALQGANKGLRRLRSKLDRLQRFLNDHQLWVEYREQVAKAEETRRLARKAQWKHLHPATFKDKEQS